MLLSPPLPWKQYLVKGSWLTQLSKLEWKESSPRNSVPTWRTPRVELSLALLVRLRLRNTWMSWPSEDWWATHCYSLDLSSTCASGKDCSSTSKAGLRTYMMEGISWSLWVVFQLLGKQWGGSWPILVRQLTVLSGSRTSMFRKISYWSWHKPWLLLTNGRRRRSARKVLGRRKISWRPSSFRNSKYTLLLCKLSTLESVTENIKTSVWTLKRIYFRVHTPC